MSGAEKYTESTTIKPYLYDLPPAPHKSRTELYQSQEPHHQRTIADSEVLDYIGNLSGTTADTFSRYQTYYGADHILTWHDQYQVFEAIEQQRPLTPRENGAMLLTSILARISDSLIRKSLNPSSQPYPDEKIMIQLTIHGLDNSLFTPDEKLSLYSASETFVDGESLNLSHDNVIRTKERLLAQYAQQTY